MSLRRLVEDVNRTYHLEHVEGPQRFGAPPPDMRKAFPSAPSAPTNPLGHKVPALPPSRPSPRVSPDAAPRPPRPASIPVPRRAETHASERGDWNRESLEELWPETKRSIALMTLAYFGLRLLWLSMFASLPALVFGAVACVGIGMMLW